MGNINLKKIKDYLIEMGAIISPYLLLFFMLILIAKYSVSDILKLVMQNNNAGEIVSIPTDEVTTKPEVNQKNHEIVITWPFTFQNNDFNINNYPAIQVNEKIEGGFIEFDVEPYSWLVDRSSYLESKNYFFAFRFFIGSIENGWYYQVFRKENGWVANDRNLNLMWAISGEEFKDGRTWIIPISDQVSFAKEKGQFGYKYLDILGYINNNVGKALKIGWFTSSVSEEPNGWKLNKINSIKIKYIGDKDAITKVK